MDLMMVTSSACLLAESMEMQKELLMDVGWVPLLELCLEQPMVMQMVMSLVCLSGEPMAMQKVMLLD